MKVDVIILSDSKTRGLTIASVESLLVSESDIEFNVIVIEDSEHEYENVTNMKIDEEFNYNRFMNLGADTSDSDYIVFSNNDLIYEEGWFTELLKHDFECMCPRSPIDFRQKDYTGDVIRGYNVGKIFSGWCFVLKRQTWLEISGLDEDFKFWYADNATVEQLRLINVEPALIVNSIVVHLGSQTLETKPRDIVYHLTIEQEMKFREKYGNK